MEQSYAIIKIDGEEYTSATAEMSAEKLSDEYYNSLLDAGSDVTCLRIELVNNEWLTLSADSVRNMQFYCKDK